MEEDNAIKDVIAELRAHIARKYKNQCGAAKAWGISDAMVSKVLNGKSAPTAAMLKDAGIRAVQTPVRYVRKNDRRAKA